MKCKRVNLFFLLFHLLIIGIILLSCDVQETQNYGSIIVKGQVTNSCGNVPVSGINVHLLGRYSNGVYISKFTKTDSLGNYRIEENFYNNVSDAFEIKIYEDFNQPQMYTFVVFNTNRSITKNVVLHQYLFLKFDAKIDTSLETAQFKSIYFLSEPIENVIYSFNNITATDTLLKLPGNVYYKSGLEYIRNSILETKIDTLIMNCDDTTYYQIYY